MLAKLAEQGGRSTPEENRKSFVTKVFRKTSAAKLSENLDSIALLLVGYVDVSLGGSQLFVASKFHDHFG